MFGQVGLVKIVSSVSKPLGIENVAVLLQTHVERSKVLLGSRQPARFREGKHTRQQLVFNLYAVVAGFSPHVALYAKAEVFLAAKACHRVNTIYSFNAVDPVVAPTALILFVNIYFAQGYLHHVEVKRLVGHYNALKALVGSLLALVDVVPSHDNRLHGVVRLPVSQEFVPADDVLVILLFKVETEFFNQPRLQFVHTGQALVLYTLQAVGIVAPLVGGAFVATKVNILVGEYFGHVAEHTLQKVDRLVLANVQHVL